MTSDPSVPSGPARCPNCNSPLSPQVKFCETCGAKIETAPVCRNCGAPLPAGVKFCEECGAPRDTPASPSPAAVPVAPPVTENAAPEIPVVPPVAPVTVPDLPVTAPTPPVVVKPETREPVQPAPSAPAAPTAPGPKTPLSKNTLIIAGVIGAVVLIAAIVFVVMPMFSGSGGSLAVPGLSSAPSSPSSASAAVGTTPTGSGQTPGPTQTLPPAYTLFFQIDKDVISGDVSVTVTGPSRNVVRDIEVRLTRADGQVITKNIIPGQKINDVIIPGTRNSERVEVTVLFYSGEQYKVIDTIAHFTKRM